MMRHAQSEERLMNVRDHDRPITEAGKVSAQEVRHMGKETNMAAKQPGLSISSR